MMSLLGCFKRKFIRGSRSSANAPTARTTSNKARANTQNNDMLNTLALTTLFDADTDDRETSALLAGGNYQSKVRAEAEQRSHEAMQDGLIGSANTRIDSCSNYSGSSSGSGYGRSSSDYSSSGSDYSSSGSDYSSSSSSSDSSSSSSSGGCD